MVAAIRIRELTRRAAVRQFVKFAVVGGASTVINLVVFSILQAIAVLSLVPNLSVAFVVSVINSFYWNRKWTFRQSTSLDTGTQAFRFLLVNLVGWVLNTAIVVLIIASMLMVTRHVPGAPAPHFGEIARSVLLGNRNQQYPKLFGSLALVAATCVVVVWNFFANRLWTFK